MSLIGATTEDIINHVGRLSRELDGHKVASNFREAFDRKI